MKKKRVNLFRISLHVYFPFLKLKKKKSRSPRQQSGIGEIFQVEAFKRIIGVMDKEEGSKFISKFVRSRISFRRKQCRARRANWSAISNLSLDEEKKSFGSRHHLWSIGSIYTLLARNFVQLRNVGGHVDSRSGGRPDSRISFNQLRPGPVNRSRDLRSSFTPLVSFSFATNHVQHTIYSISNADKYI